VYKVLAVDDSHVIRRLVEVSLQQLNLEVRTVASGRDACASLEALDIDLMILDVGLPDMSGFDVLAHVTGEPALDGLPVVMLTGYSEADDRARADRAGVDRYLVKPFRPADLRSAVLEILNGGTADEHLGSVSKD
jgi:two-component system, OmpR family, response regulator